MVEISELVKVVPNLKLYITREWLVTVYDRSGEILIRELFCHDREEEVEETRKRVDDSGLRVEVEVLEIISTCREWTSPEDSLSHKLGLIKIPWAWENEVCGSQCEDDEYDRTTYEQSML